MDFYVISFTCLSWRKTPFESKLPEDFRSLPISEEYRIPLEDLKVTKGGVKVQ